MYSREGVAETWVVELPGDQVWVYRDPTPEGYQTVTTHHRGEHISPRAFPDLQLAIDDILG